MKLCTLKEVLTHAWKGRYAIPAFTVVSLGVVSPLLKVAEEEKSPVILHPRPVKEEVDYIKALSENASIPVVLNLDHGRNFEVAMRAIRIGYTSVMIDGSALPFDQNIAVTKQVAQVAHVVGVSVEGELGHVGRPDAPSEDTGLLTDPKTVKEFVEKADVDCLAVSIGTAHGAYKFKGKPKLDFDRLAQINKVAGIPLVLHGGSGVLQDIVAKATKYGGKLGDMRGNEDEQLVKTIELGITKINIGTDLRLAYLAGLRELFMEKPEAYATESLQEAANVYVAEVARHKMRVFKSSGKA